PERPVLQLPVHAGENRRRLVGRNGEGRLTNHILKQASGQRKHPVLPDAGQHGEFFRIESDQLDLGGAGNDGGLKPVVHFQVDFLRRKLAHDFRKKFGLEDHASGAFHIGGDLVVQDGGNKAADGNVGVAGGQAHSGRIGFQLDSSENRNGGPRRNRFGNLSHSLVKGGTEQGDFHEGKTPRIPVYFL